MVEKDMTNEIKLIDEELSKVKETVTFIKVFSIDGIKLRIKIVSDIYDFQCSAIIQVFNKEKLEWNFLHSISSDNMSTPTKLYCFPYNNDLKKLFKIDVNHLNSVAREILF